MSVELTVVPLHKNGFSLLRSLQFDRRDYNKYELLKEKGKYLQDRSYVEFNDLYDPGRADYITKDCYGNPIIVIKCGEFLALYTIDKPTTWDEANLAFLKKLGPGHPLLLYFH